MLQLIERWRIIHPENQDSLSNPKLAVAKEVTVYMGLKGSTQVISFEVKRFSSFVGKSPSLL